MSISNLSFSSKAVMTGRCIITTFTRKPENLKKSINISTQDGKKKEQDK